MQLTNRDHDVTVALQAMFGEWLKNFARCREGDFTAVAVEEARAHLIFQGANLRRDRRLSNHELFRGAGKASQTAYFQKGSQLLEIHARFESIPAESLASDT